MTLLITGTLNFERMDAEVIALADDFRAFGVAAVAVSFNFGCYFDYWAVGPEPFFVPTGELVRSLAEAEADGLFEMGESNVTIAGGGLEFLLCHERDVHCSGEESAALHAVRRRWARTYEHAYEQRSGGRSHGLRSLRRCQSYAEQRKHFGSP